MWINVRISYNSCRYRHCPKCQGINRERWIAAQQAKLLDATEFLRRFCLHILPKGFRKMRHYGFLSNRNRNSAKLSMQQMHIGIVPQPKQKVKKQWKEVAKEKLNYDVDVCPCCKAGKMITLIAFDAHGPPAWAVDQRKQRAAVINS